MIVRILGEGQFHLQDEHLVELNELDDALADAVNAGEGPRFRQCLTDLLGRTRSLGTPVADEYLGGSDLILPHAASTLTEVRALLGEEGLIPG
jgi:hypothetical protein